jgi:hypothetical protein
MERRDFLHKNGMWSAYATLADAAHSEPGQSDAITTPLGTALGELPGNLHSPKVDNQIAPGTLEVAGTPLYNRRSTTARPINLWLPR